MALSYHTVQATNAHFTPEFIQAEQELEGCRNPSVLRRVREVVTAPLKPHKAE